MSLEDLKRRVQDASLICQDIDDSEAIVMITGAVTSELDAGCCDVCRFRTIQALTDLAAVDMWNRYRRQRKNNARH